jgi:DNA-directed RNA polymerase specialized sigma subunit
MTKEKMDRMYMLSMAPDVMDRMPESRRAWYETESEVRAGLRWGKRKAELMKWLRKEMGRRLTAREQHCLELYFFKAMNYEQIGSATNTVSSSAFRAVRRALRKLKSAAEADSSWRRPKRGRLRLTRRLREDGSPE